MGVEGGGGGLKKDGNEGREEGESGPGGAQDQ